MIRFSDFYSDGKPNKALDQVRERTVDINGFQWRLQYNPARFTSSSARVDVHSISERPCFLCENNRPADQKAVNFGDYVILANPRPVFHRHLTIPHRRHQPQLISGAFGDVLDLSRALGPGGIVLYNGPRCGASAPDHLHFQAGEHGFLPIDNNLEDVIAQYGSQVPDVLTDPDAHAVSDDYTGSNAHTDPDANTGSNTHTVPDTHTPDRPELIRVDDGLRRFLVLRSDKKEALVHRFDEIYETFRSFMKQKEAEAGKKREHDTELAAAIYEEPKLNLLVRYDATVWRVIIFFRAKHRPSCYYLDEDRRMIFSPGAVEFGGVCIFPNKEDFKRVTEEELLAMFREVSIRPDDFGQIIRDL